MATGQRLSHVFPLGSRVNERGRLEVGGCDVVELAERVRHARLRRRRGRPARPRPRLHARPAATRPARTSRSCSPPRRSPARPCCALFAAGGPLVRRRLRRRAAPGAARRLRPPQRIVLHGNAKSDAELRMALDAGVGPIVIDNFDEIERLERADRGGRAGRERASQPVLVRVTPDVRGRDPREDLDRPGRLEVRLRDGRRRRARSSGVRASTGLSCAACTPTSAPSCSTLEPFRARRGARERSASFRRVGPRRRARRRLHRRISEPPSIEDYVARDRRRGRDEHRRRRQAPADRAGPLAGRQRARHALHGRDRQAQRLDLGRGRRRHVRQPAADALRRALRGAHRRPPRRRDAPACSPASTASPAT